jgi:type I restriction enzyme S subunit
MTGWRVTTLGDVITLQRGFDLTEKTANPGPYPVFSSGGLSYTTDSFKVDGPGVITGRKGVLGKVHYSPGPYWPHDTTLWVKDFKGAVPRFIYYFLQTLPLAQLDAGASNPTLNRNHAHLLPVTVPDLATQERIAGVLASLDELIVINRRRVEVLEDMAREIYREWFVRFRFPGNENVALVDSDAGPIPNGWQVTAVAEVASIDKGLSYKGMFLTDTGTPMANLKCFARDGGFRRDGTKPYSGPFKPKHTVQPGDLVLANADLTQAGAVIGSPALIPRRGFEDGGIISHHLFAVRLNDMALTPFLYQEFGGPAFRAYARGVASGTTVLGFRPADVLAYKFVLPPERLLSNYAALASDIRQSVDDLEDATEILGTIRDVLLPKLVTGQIEVSRLDLDAFVEGAVA